MKESYRENLASSSGHEPYAGSGSEGHSARFDQQPRHIKTFLDAGRLDRGLQREAGCRFVQLPDDSKVIVSAWFDQDIKSGIGLLPMIFFFEI
jgi:hypothetical protein